MLHYKMIDSLLHSGAINSAIKTSPSLGFWVYIVPFSVYCTVYTVQCIVYTAQSTAYNVPFSVHCSVYVHMVDKSLVSLKYCWIMINSNAIGHIALQ